MTYEVLSRCDNVKTKRESRKDTRMKKSQSKVKITVRALFQRINRRLAPDFEKLCTARSERVQAQFGALLHR